MKQIRKTETGDLPAVLGIYAEAREFMRESGNPDQWSDTYPPRELIESDIRAGNSYVCYQDQDGEIVAVFYFAVEPEPTYEQIEGKWLDDAPYGVVHRVARRSGTGGMGAFCIDWCFEQCRNIRIDTHRDNAPMRKLLAKLGFAYCGVIRLEDGAERLAFQKISG